MAAPPPPPPPPPPGPSNIGKPDNKKLLASICHGTTLKKIPDSMKNDRSAVILTSTQGSGGAKNSSGPLIPTSKTTMTFAEELAAKHGKKGIVQQTDSQIPIGNKPPPNQKITASPLVPHDPPNLSNSKRSGAPLPNSLPPPVAPPPPSANNKPQNIAPPPAPIRMPSNLPPPPSHPSFNPAAPPPPPPKDSKPNFRQPIPICSKPMINGDYTQNRGMQPNQFCSPIPPPPPMLPPMNDVRPPRFGLPPPPPPSSTMPITKPDPPIRPNFDSRFIFMEMEFFPNPNTMIKIRQT